MTAEVSKTDWKDLRIRAFFGVLTLIVAVGLLAVRQVTISGLRAARSWTPTPCLIERSEFVVDDSGGERVRYLDLVYRYEVEGVSYSGDLLDMMPGSMGDDAGWEESLHNAYPEGALATCYVDPDRPERSVLDRTHGDGSTGNLLLLATPFLAISAAFLFSVGWTVQRHRSAQLAAKSDAPSIPPPPRTLSVWQRLALLQASKQTLLAWAFLVGFVIVFRMMEGPGHLRDLVASGSVTVDGRIIRVAPASQRSLGGQDYEFAFEYNYEGRKRQGVSYIGGRRFEVDDRVNVLVNPQQPDDARIERVRARAVPFWVVMIPGAVIVLLLLGIVGSYIFSLRSWNLARHGAVAEAQLVDAGRSDVANPLTRHEFTIDGDPYQVDIRSALPPTLQRCCVLYRPEAPHCNLGLTPQQATILTGEIVAWKSALLSLSLPVICVAAVVWIIGL